MGLLKLSCRPPDLPLVREHVDQVGSHRSTRLKVTSRRRRIRVVHPGLQPLIFLDIDMQRRLDDPHRRRRGTLVLAPFGLFQPGLSVHHDFELGQPRHSGRHDALYFGDVARLFRQPSGRDPDLVRGRDRLSGFVEHLLGRLWGFQSGEREPEVDGRRDKLDRSR